MHHHYNCPYNCPYNTALTNLTILSLQTLQYCPYNPYNTVLTNLTMLSLQTLQYFPYKPYNTVLTNCFNEDYCVRLNTYCGYFVNHKNVTQLLGPAFAVADIT